MANLYVSRHNEHPGLDVDSRIINVLLQNKRVTGVFLDVTPGRRQADLIVFTLDGVHVLEVKDYPDVTFDETNAKYAPWHTPDGKVIVNIRGRSRENPVQQAYQTAEDVKAALARTLRRRKGELPVWPYVLLPFPSPETRALFQRVRGRTGVTWLVASVDNLARDLANRDNQKRALFEITFTEDLVQRIARAWGLKKTTSLHGVPISPQPEKREQEIPSSPPTPPPSPTAQKEKMRDLLRRWKPSLGGTRRLNVLRVLALIVAVLAVFLIFRLLFFRACVTAQALNVRSGPGTTYNIIRVLQKDQCFRADGRTADGRWVHIKGGGWVSAAYVKGMGISHLPVIRAETKTAAVTPASLAFSRHGLTVKVTRVERQGDRLLVHLELQNTSGASYTLPIYRNFYVVDEQGRQYEGHPFLSQIATEVVSGARVTGYVVVPNVPPEGVRRISIRYVHVYGFPFVLGEGVRIDNVPVPYP